MDRRRRFEIPEIAAVTLRCDDVILCSGNGSQDYNEEPAPTPRDINLPVVPI